MKTKILLLVLIIFLMMGCQTKTTPHQEAPISPSPLENPYEDLTGEDIELIIIHYGGETTLPLRDAQLHEKLADILAAVEVQEEIDAANLEEANAGIDIKLSREIAGEDRLHVIMKDEEALYLANNDRVFLIKSKELVDFIETHKNQKIVLIREYQVLDEAHEWFEEFNRELEGIYVYQHPHGTFIKITAGEKPTGGYGIGIKNYIHDDHPRKIEVVFTEPKGDDVVTTALTYPTVYIRINSEEASRYEAITNDGRLIPMEDKLIFAVIEMPEANEVVASPFMLKGRIVAFEGAFVMRILDGNENVLHEEYLQSDAGGPSWGKFNVEITFKAEGIETGYIELGEYSAEDGEYILRTRIPVAFQ